jgi:Cu-Zn family superoxide dismutase
MCDIGVLQREFACRVQAAMAAFYREARAGRRAGGVLAGVPQLASATRFAYDALPSAINLTLRTRAWNACFLLQRGDMRRALSAIAVTTLLAGCAATPPAGPSARADLTATRGNTAAGTVTFTRKGDGVLVHAVVSGLVPGSHGFHIHEKGDCSSGDGISAGGHFNPLGEPHAEPANPHRHAGDMPMLVADAAGRAMLDAELDVITVAGGPADVVGRAVIVHKDPDDFKTQPTGNSGARVACGVIRSS